MPETCWKVRNGPWNDPLAPLRFPFIGKGTRRKAVGRVLDGDLSILSNLNSPLWTSVSDGRMSVSESYLLILFRSRTRRKDGDESVFKGQNLRQAMGPPLGDTIGARRKGH